MNQYTLKVVYQNIDELPISALQREIIRGDLAKQLQDHHPKLMFDIEEVKE